VEQIHWGLDDPYHGWEADPQDLPPYRETRDELKKRIEGFLLGKEKTRKRVNKL